MSVIALDDVYTTLQGIFRKEFGDPNLTIRRDMTADEVEGWDSHSQVTLMLACEEAFGVRLKTREINGLENVGEMVDHLIRAISRH
ncbi:MAG: Acyl carrier protein [Rhodospirillales bacterium]|nr:Acyl carrier protein [Rhodospirillales bacterium]